MKELIETSAILTPKAGTHTLIIDVLNKDASVKRIEVSFCCKDRWSEALPGSLNIAELIEACFHNLVKNDKYSIGSKLTLINKATGAPLPIIFNPLITKSEFIVS